MGYNVKKGNLQYSHLQVLGKYSLEKFKLNILRRIFCLSKKVFFMKLPVQKTGWTSLGKVPAPDVNGL